MNPEIVAAIVTGIGAISTAIVAGIRMLFKKIEKYLAELKPNGGNSIKDQINRLDKGYERLNDGYSELNNRLELVESKLDMLVEAFKDYIKGK